jgi:hypothetical protein
MPAAEIGRLKRAGVTAAGLLVLAPALVQGQVDWPEYGGPGSIKYSPLDRITPDNVGMLKFAWQWESGEEPRPAESLAFPATGASPSGVAIPGVGSSSMPAGASSRSTRERGSRSRRSETVAPST